MGLILSTLGTTYHKVDGPRTNNHVEGWHGKINQQQLASEGAATSTRRKYRLKEKRIVTIIEKFDFGDYSLNEYINSLSGWVLSKHYC